MDWILRIFLIFLDFETCKGHHAKSFLLLIMTMFLQAACSSSFSFQTKDSEDVRTEIETENDSATDLDINMEKDPTATEASGDKPVPLSFSITENIVLTEDDEEQVILSDHKVAANRETSGGTYLLLVATAPDCQDHGLVSINAMTGEVKFRPMPEYHGVCNLKIQFQESASSKVDDEVAVTVQEYCSVNSAKTPYANSDTSVDGSSTGKAYRICTAAQLNHIGSSAMDMDKHFLLKSDLDLSDFTSTAFNIIGDVDVEFSGVFDGNNHIISNFTYSNSSQVDPVGLFGAVNGGTVKNLHLRAVDLTVDYYEITGSLVGDCFNCTLENVSVSGQMNVTTPYTYGVGGIVGDCYGSCTIRKAASNVIITVSNNSYVGGIAGDNSGVVEDSYALGAINGSGTDSESIGGLVGNSFNGQISRAYAVGNVHGSYRIGGLVGISDATVEYGFATGSVTALNDWDEVSHVVGTWSDAITSEVYYDVNGVCTEGGTPCDGINGTGIDLTVTPNYFYLKSNPPLSFWDFDSVWEEVPGSYPKLRGQPDL